MISIEKLKRVTVVYTRAHCPDGLASAMILKDAFRMLGTNPRIEFLAHGTSEHRNAQPPTHDQSTILFCDIAPWVPPDSEGRAAQIERMRNWAQFHPTAIVLDHHVGAKEIVEAFGENGVYADAEKEPSVSGAVLAWREIWQSILNTKVLGPERAKDPGVEVYRAVRDFALSVGARDTWQTKDERFMRGQYISKMLMSKPASWWLEERYVDPSNSGSGSVTVLKKLIQPYLDEIEIAIGRSFFEAHENAVSQAAEQCVRFDVGPDDIERNVWKVVRPTTALYVFQEQATGFRLCSDVAEALRQRHPELEAVVAGFSYVVDKPGSEPKLVYSLRGLNGFDVCALAKTNGGGGHKAAAGFSMSMNDIEVDPYEEIRARLEMFLEGDTKR